MLKLLQKHLYIVYFTLFNDNMINQSILVAVDSLIFTILNNQLSIVLVERTIEPYKDMRAIPGGFVLESESLEEAAKRKLADEAGVNNAYMEQLYTFGNLQRDPRGRVVSCAYVAVIAYDQLKLKA
jgi:8-oxo-dGTP diphosphatase